jgi:hypothetical protein
MDLRKMGSTRGPMERIRLLGLSDFDTEKKKDEFEEEEERRVSA